MDTSSITNESEALSLINELTNKFRLTKKKISEEFNSSTTVIKTKTSTKVKIRLLSYNEAILKLMVPYGNKQNVPSNYAYPWKISEGKYGIMHRIDGIYMTQQQKYSKNVNVPGYRLTATNRISIINALYEMSFAGQGTIGLLSQNANWYYFSNRSNGYALNYQDNYEDKPEIRVQNYYTLENRNAVVEVSQSNYSKNGNAINSGGDSAWNGGASDSGYRGSTGHWGGYTWQVGAATLYKTSGGPYYGFLPVFAA